MKLANITSVYRSKLIITSYHGWLNRKQRVLDVGCGTGVVFAQLNKYYKFKKAIGCDIENYLISDIKFKKMSNFSILPFGGRVFDVAMFNDVLHHTTYDNQRKLIIESLRVAKSVLLFELKPTFIGKKGDYLVNKIHNPNMNIPYTYRDLNGWKELFKKLEVKFSYRKVESPLWYPFKHMAFKLTS